MPKAICPECDELREIAVADQPVGRTGTALRWRVDAHRDTRAAEPKVCDGSGKLV